MKCPRCGAEMVMIGRHYICKKCGARIIRSKHIKVKIE